MSQSPNWFVLIIPFCIALLVGGLFFFRRYTGLSRGAALFALLASVIGGALHVIFRLRNLSPATTRNADAIVSALAAGASIVLMTAFAFRLWGRWIDEKATAEERQPGVPGVRAWFGVANVVVGTAIVLLTWFGFDISPILGAAVVGGLLAAYPLLRMESVSATSPPPPSEDFSAEREKIVSMLEAGKLTADESAELLQTLGETSRQPSRQIPLTGGQRMMLIGAALVLIGFFLPWFVFNAGKEATRMMNQMQNSVESTLAGMVEVPGIMIPGAEIKTPSVSVSGGDIRRGLGWATLVLAAIAALLPYVGSSLDAATQRTIRLLALGSGSVIVLYLVTQHIRFVTIGLVLVMAGYALEIAGALRGPIRQQT